MFPERHWKPLTATLREVSQTGPSCYWSDLGTVAAYVARAEAYASPKRPVVLSVYDGPRLIHGQLIPNTLGKGKRGIGSRGSR
jgi:hypothetical protein